MRTRFLPEAEWPRLKGTEAETLWPSLTPESARVLVVEDDGEIVATWVFMRVVHAHCFGIAPEYRGHFGVTKGLMRGLREVGDEWGVDRVITGSVSPHVTELIQRFGGFPMPCETFVLPVDIVGSKRVADRELGRLFHEQLQAQLPEEIHAEDVEHDERVGRALRTAIHEGDPEKAEREYNAWARGAGYEPIAYLGTEGGCVRADIKSALVGIWPDYRVKVLAREAVCPS